MPQRFLLVAATFSVSVLLYVDRVCISTAKEPISRHLGLEETQWGWVLSAFAFGYALCQTPAGILADRWGARRVLAGVVIFWSVFTGLTALAWNYGVLLTVRFLFGAGEAGAFPAIARGVYAWIPVQERGLIKGINFSGARIGAAVTLPLLPALFAWLDWQGAFVLLMVIGVVWACAWLVWFRDDPSHMRRMDPRELQYILTHRQSQGDAATEQPSSSWTGLLWRASFWCLLLQYFCSNFTFFFCLTWLYPHVKNTYRLDAVDAGFLSMVPLLAGALGNIVSGFVIDRLYGAGHRSLSRRLPAMAGFAMAATGLLGSVGQETAGGAIAWLALAIFGADMTISPSWSVCIDVGGRHAGAVSGTMNMAGNLGSALTGIAFPYLTAWAGVELFFYVGAALNILAVVLWVPIRPRHGLTEVS
ncbi:MAG: MFS transporter [Pirellulaceae bacterium]